MMSVITGSSALILQKFRGGTTTLDLSLRFRFQVRFNGRYNLPAHSYPIALCHIQQAVLVEADFVLF